MVDYDRDTALLVVDIQYDFAHPDGSLFVPGAFDVVKAVNREIEKALDAATMIVYTQDWHPESTPHFEKDGGVWPVHCVADSWGAAFHDDLIVAGPVVRKGEDGSDGYSGFSVRDPETGETGETQLGYLLADRKSKRVVIAGLATDYCVVETALDAVNLGFATTVLTHAVAGVDLQSGDSDRAFARMQEAGVTLA